MKLVRKTTVLMLVVIMVMSIMVLPASAASLSHDVNLQFEFFDTVYYNNQYSGYTVALQRFLQCYSQTYANILKNAEKNGNKGVDGWFGEYTYSALTKYQGSHGLDPDGWAGSNTWKKIANSLSEDTYAAYKILSVNNKSVIGAFIDRGLLDYFIYYDGNGNGGQKFHNCVTEM